jgi:putative PIN family toxin of toxin-antitoxin system
LRAVLDPNVIISAVLSPSGAPARVVRHWLDGAYELVVSPMLLDELSRALAYPKLRKRISAAEAEELLHLLRRNADVVQDPTSAPPVRSPDPDDDYLITLAASAQAVLVSGDTDLLGLGDDIPASTPADFLSGLEAQDR